MPPAPVQFPPSQARLGIDPAIPIDGNVQRETAGYVAPGQCAFTVNIDKISIASAVTVPLITPRVNMTFFVTDLGVTHDSTVAIRCAITITLGANTLTVWSWPVKGDTAPFEAPGIETPIDVPAGATLNMVFGSNAGTNGYANIAGIVQALGAG